MPGQAAPILVVGVPLWTSAQMLVNKRKASRENVRAITKSDFIRGRCFIPTIRCYALLIRLSACCLIASQLHVRSGNTKLSAQSLTGRSAPSIQQSASGRIMNYMESRLMKGLSVLMLCLLAGCAARPTMEQLELQAFNSGDWSAVEQRERMQARIAKRAPVQCPARLVAVCVNQFGNKKCSCVRSSDLQMSLINR